MKRPCKDIKKIIWMKWRLLTFTKVAKRRHGRLHSLKKHQSHPNQMNLKEAPKSPGFIDEGQKVKKASGQAMEKRPPQRHGKKLKRPYNLRNHKNHPN